MADTASVLGHHVDAFDVGVDEIMKDYTEDSIFISQEGTARGLTAIRAWFERFLAEPFVRLATDTFIVRGGKIAYQTFAAHANPAR
jgi:hypothetical protein